LGAKGEIAGTTREPAATGVCRVGGAQFSRAGFRARNAFARRLADAARFPAMRPSKPFLVRFAPSGIRRLGPFRLN
jgi:hypothetical protein